MDEQIYFEDNGGSIVVSNQRFTIFNETVDVSNIDDFDLENRRSLDGISLSLNDGLKIGTSLLQLVLISPLGRKPAFVPVDLRRRIDQIQLRGLVLALSRAIGERKQHSNLHRPLEEQASKLPPVLSKPITVTYLPRELSQLEAKILRLMQEPDKEYRDTNERFTNSISNLLSGTSMGQMNHPVTAKIIYEYQRVHGHRNSRLRLFGGSSVTVGQVFRPLLPDEVESFRQFYSLVTQSPLPQFQYPSEV